VVPEPRPKLTASIERQPMKTINGETKLIGLLGNPVSHSLSPSIQNAALEAMHLNWCYLALPCPEDQLSSILTGLLHANCKGLNITIPFKTKIAKLCTELSPLAHKLQAVNTIIPNSKGGWYGTNTDVEGFLFPLRKEINKEKSLALVLGCGGSARAIIAGLIELKYKAIIIIGRKQKSIENFITDLNQNKIIPEDIDIKGILYSDINIVEYVKNSNLIVNTTPIGMLSEKENQNVINLPFNEELWFHLNAKTTLYDLIYTPRPTAWLKKGKKIGCKTIDGLEMLLQQGAASLRLWSGITEIPIDVMREAAENQLKI